MFKEVMTSASFYQMLCAPKWKYSRSLFWWHVISDFPVTCHVPDARIVIAKWINHLHLNRWICKEPFYMACSKCSGASFFLPPGYIYTSGFGILQLLAMEAHISSVPPSCWGKTEEQDLPSFMPKNTLTCAEWKEGDTVYTKRSTSLNSLRMRRCFTGFTSQIMQI